MMTKEAWIITFCVAAVGITMTIAFLLEALETEDWLLDDKPTQPHRLWNWNGRIDDIYIVWWLLGCVVLLWK